MRRILSRDQAELTRVGLAEVRIPVNEVEIAETIAGGFAVDIHD
jgi:hypothetical protein